MAWLAAGLLLATAGCGNSEGSSTAGAGRPDLTVAAASSLTAAFTEYGKQFRQANARFSFAGSDELAAQIRQGVKPDVFASANTTLPAMLHAEGLVSKPVLFASNRLVIAVPAGSSKLRALSDLARPGVTIAVGAPAVPIGAYTRKVLAGLPAAEDREILANVRSNEPEVKGVIAKVAERAVDAGFVYATDVEASGGKARAIRLPDSLQPEVAYAAAVVKRAKHPQQARAFIAGLLQGPGQSDLRRAGFLAPPR